MTRAEDGSPRATTAGLTKIPTPTMPPITSITAPGNPIATFNPSLVAPGPAMDRL